MFRKKNRFNHTDIGWNYRLSNVQAALGVNQLKRINKIVKKKELIGKKYYLNLKDNKNIKIQKPYCSFAKNIYWVVGIVIKNNKHKINAQILAKKLINYGIQTRPFFWPMNKQTALIDLKLINKKQKYPNSNYLSKYGLYLPASLNITDKEINFVCDKINSIFKN